MKQEHRGIFFEQEFGKTKIEMSRAYAGILKEPGVAATKRFVIVSISVLILAGCSGGLSSSNAGGSSATPTLNNCGGCDVAGRGGSLYLMKTGNAIGSMAISLPADVWNGGCVNGTGSSRKNFIVVSATSEAYVIGRIYSATGCNEADWDMVKTQRYWFASMGTASVSFDANTLRTQLAQVWEEPHSASTVNDIDARCSGVAGTTTLGVARDTSICLSDSGSGSPYSIAVNETSTLFWTDGNTLKLGSAVGLAIAGTDGYFTR